MFFANHARTVTLIVRGDSLEKSMSQYLVNQVRIEGEHPRGAAIRGRRPFTARAT